MFLNKFYLLTIKSFCFAYFTNIHLNEKVISLLMDVVDKQSPGTIIFIFIDQITVQTEWLQAHRVMSVMIDHRK